MSNDDADGWEDGGDGGHAGYSVWYYGECVNPDDDAEEPIPEGQVYPAWDVNRVDENGDFIGAPEAWRGYVHGEFFGDWPTLTEAKRAVAAEAEKRTKS